MFLNNEIQNFLPLMGFLGNQQSRNPFVNMFNNIAQMRLMQSMYAPQQLTNNQQNYYQNFNTLPAYNQQPINNTEMPAPQPTSGVLNNFTQGATSATNNIVNRIANAIAMVESSDNYGALGPRTKSGDRAFGRYQVMGNNIPVWTKEVLGQSLTPQQFLANKEAQDRVALAKMGQYYNRYGTPHDVASMWFSGRPAQNNWRKDVTGTSVPEYMRRVLKYMN